MPHKEHSDRLINDRRPFNAIEGRLKWAKLPHGTMLMHLIVKQGETARASGDDLESFFYTLEHLQEWLARNAVGKPFEGEGFEEFGGVPGSS